MKVYEQEIPFISISIYRHPRYIDTNCGGKVALHERSTVYTFYRLMTTQRRHFVFNTALVKDVAEAQSVRL
jgi:hypothetical protein